MGSGTLGAPVLPLPPPHPWGLPSLSPHPSKEGRRCCWEAHPGSSPKPYPGHRRAQRLEGGRPQQASHVALLGSPGGSSSPARRTAAPGAGSRHPLPLLPAPLPLWAHGGVVTASPGPRDRDHPPRPGTRPGEARRCWQETAVAPPAPGPCAPDTGVATPRHEPPPPSSQEGRSERVRTATTRVDGAVCWHRALPPGRTFPGTGQGQELALVEPRTGWARGTEMHHGQQPGH